MDILQNLNERQGSLVKKILQQSPLTTEEEVELKVVSEILNASRPIIKITVAQHDEITVNSTLPVTIEVDNTRICWVPGTNVTVKELERT